MDDLYDLDLIKPVFIPVPESLRDLLASGTTTTEEILRQDITFRLFRTANPQLINFFCIHIDQLLKLAFDPAAEMELSSKAFAILEHSQPTVIAAVLSGQKLHRTACGILDNNDAKEKTVLLNRLASLTLSAMYIDQTRVIESCGFILQLIDCLDEPGILSLFESMCTPFEGLDKVQKWLVQIGFPQALLKYIDDFPCQREADRMSERANQLCGLFSIICVCGSSPILGPHVCTDAFVTVLNRTIGEYPDFVEHQRWETFSALYCPKTMVNMRGLLANVLEILMDPERARTRSGAAAIDLLTVVIQIDKELVPFIIEMNIASTIFRLIIENPNHTQLHMSAIEFMKAVFKNDGLRTPILDEVLGVLIVAFREKNQALRFTLYKLVKALVKAAKVDQKLNARLRKVPAFSDVLRGPLMDYRHLLKNPFGGPIRCNVDENVNAIAQRAMSHSGI